MINNSTKSQRLAYMLHLNYVDSITNYLLLQHNAYNLRLTILVLVLLF